MNPFVSIIIPVYNVEKYLKKCIDSILKQSFSNYEIILVNDGSTDKSKLICEEYSEKHNCITVLNQANMGSGYARNNGLKIAKGKYIYFCDADDYLESNLLEENIDLIELFQANLVIFGHYNESTKGKVNKQIYPKEYKYLESKKEFREAFIDLYNNHLMNTLWNKVYKKDFILNFDFSNAKTGQDTLFNLDVYGDLSKVILNPKIYYHYIENRKDSAVNRGNEKRFEQRITEGRKLLELLKKWNLKEAEMEDLVSEHWYLTVSLGVRGILYTEYNERIKKEQLKIIFENPNVKKYVLNLKSNKIKRKIKVFLFKHYNNSLCLNTLKWLIK